MEARFLFLCLVCVTSSCAAIPHERPPEAGEQVRSPTSAGTTAVALVAGVASVYEVDSTVTVVDANFGEPSRLHGDLEGRYGVGLQLEHFLLDDWMLFLGFEQRAFEPDLGDDNITFGESTQEEIFLGTRYLLPWSPLESGRLRPFLQTKLAWIPSVEFDLTTRLRFDPPLEDAVLVAPYRGSDYWTLGAGAGLAYELSEDCVISLGGFYEWPLSQSEGRSRSRLEQETGNSFVDNLLDGLEYDVEIEPRGWIAFLRISYAF